MTAICGVGTSTKAAAECHIGESGIGFKSVFAIAKKVHIQSGLWSFRFEHKTAERASERIRLGMITPIEEPRPKLPAGTRTRITLTLFDDVDYDGLLKSFRAIPDTTLVFLRKLQELRVKLYPQAQEDAEYTRFRKRQKQQDALDVIIVDKIQEIGSKATSSQQKLFVIKGKAGDLPNDQARIMETRADGSGRYINDATTILAFPVAQNDVPILEEQYLFAGLPIRRAGFKFLIQSDFTTLTSQEDVIHSPRNKELRDRVARVFSAAVIRFCNHKTLQYQWMRYLPDESVTDDFWIALRDKICNSLRAEFIMRPWSEQALCLPAHMTRLPPKYCDENGEPLLRDVPGRFYLSRQYLECDFEILRKRLGMQPFTWGDLVEQLRADINNPYSRWKSINCTLEWRTRLCDLLLQLFEKHLALAGELKWMALAPIADGTWASPEQQAIYFPDDGKFPIPTDLGSDLKLIYKTAIKNSSWRRVLSHLGVTMCPPDVVIAFIANRYTNDDNARSISIGNSIAHLRYLYWNLSRDELVADLGIRLFDHKEQLVSNEDNLYFKDAEGVGSLVELFAAKAGDGVDLPGYDIHCLHDNYLNAVDETANRNGLSWRSWLETAAGVMRNPQLCNSDSFRFTKEFEYIFKYRSDSMWRVPTWFRSTEEQESNFLQKKSHQLRIQNLKLQVQWQLMSTEITQTMKSEIKQEMKLLSDPGLTSDDVAGIQDARVFPVIHPDGQSSYTTANSRNGSLEFAIMDNVLHRNAFRNKVPQLDFSVEEIRDTRTFLTAFDLKRRFTSELVKEVSGYEGSLSCRDEMITQAFRLKTSALLR